MCVGDAAAHIASMLANLTDAAKSMANSIKECHKHTPKLTISRRGVIKPKNKKGNTSTRGRGVGGAKKRKGSTQRCAPPKDDAGPSFRYDKGDDDGYEHAFTGASHKLGGVATGLSRLVPQM